MKLRYFNDVVTLEYNKDLCTGCGRCIDVCPRCVFQMNDKKVDIQDKNACIECGACMINCAFNAIKVRPGVGCAYAIIVGKIRGTEPQCGCSDNNTTSSGCCG